MGGLSLRLGWMLVCSVLATEARGRVDMGGIELFLKTSSHAPNHELISPSPVARTPYILHLHISKHTRVHSTHTYQS